MKEKGMPTYKSEIVGDTIVWKQSDPFGRGLEWKENFSSTIVKDGKNRVIIPNVDGRGYGLFRMDSLSAKFILNAFEQYKPKSASEKSYSIISDEVTRASLLISLNENMLAGTISPEMFVSSLLKYIQNEENTLLFARAVGYITSCYSIYLSGNGADLKLENELWKIVEKSSENQHKTIAFRAYTGISNSPEAALKVYEIWMNPSNFKYVKLSERDLMRIAFELSIRLPEKSKEIFQIQLNRIKNADRRKEFAFIFPSTSPYLAVRDSVFNSLLNAKNREVEPWAASALGYLNHYLREKESLKYLKHGLEIIPDIQRTGDIFFPQNWLRALLGGHNSNEAKKAVDEYLASSGYLQPILRQKILQQADHLLRKRK